MLYKRHTFRIALLTVLPLALLSLNCFQEPLSPIMPSWDTNLTVPLANRLYTVSEIITKDTTLLKTGSGNQITVSKSVAFKPTYVNDLLTLNPRDTSVQMQFGAFEVTVADQVTPIDIPWLPKGYTVPVPDTSMVLTDVQSKLPSFENITLRSGTVSLKIDNNLPVAMDIQGPIYLRDQSGSIVATFSFSPARIAPHSSRTASDNLAGKTFDSDYQITGLQFHTPGSTTPVTIPSGNLLVATISASNLKASRATVTDLPAQRMADGDTARLRIDDSTVVRELYMRSGGLRFSFTNGVPLAMVFKFRFTELQRRVGSSYVPYEDSLALAPSGTGSMTLNLANTRIKTLDGSLVKSLSVLSSVAIASVSGQTVTLSETDRVSVAVTKVSSIVVDSAVGVVKPTWVNIDSKIGLNLGVIAQKFSGQINVPSASLTLATQSSIGFPADMYVRIGAKKNAAGDSVFMTIPASQRRVASGQDFIHLDPSEVGRFLTQVSGKLPDSIRIVGRALVNPDDVYLPNQAGVGTVGSNSSIGGSVIVDLPLTLGIANGYVRDTLALGDTTGDGHKDFTLDKEKTKHLNSGKVYVEIENGLPVGVSVKLALLDRTQRLLLSVPQSGSPLTYAAASVDGDGNVVAPSKSTRVIELTAQEAEQYNPAELISYAVQMNTTDNGPAVKFKTTDNVRVRVWTHLKVKVVK